MQILFYVLLILIVLLAIASGVAKILLMPQEVAFFGELGFNNALLIGFGVVQCIAGILLAITKTRLIGAGLIAITFLVSAIVLFVAGNVPMALLTLVFVAALAWVSRFKI